MIFPEYCSTTTPSQHSSLRKFVIRPQHNNISASILRSSKRLITGRKTEDRLRRTFWNITAREVGCRCIVTKEHVLEIILESCLSISSLFPLAFFHPTVSSGKCTWNGKIERSQYLLYGLIDTTTTPRSRKSSSLGTFLMWGRQIVPFGSDMILPYLLSFIMRIYGIKMCPGHIYCYGSLSTSWFPPSLAITLTIPLMYLFPSSCIYVNLVQWTGKGGLPVVFCYSLFEGWLPQWQKLWCPKRQGRSGSL